MVFIHIYVSYFGVTLDKKAEGKCTLDIPVQGSLFTFIFK